MKDIEEIKYLFKEVIRYSQCFSSQLSLNIDPIFDQWLISKRDFIDKMNGNLFYEYPERISFTMGEESKKESYNDFLDDIYYKYNNYYLYEYLKSLPIEDFYQNKISVNQNNVCGYNGTNIIIPKGMKVIKTFKYFEDNIDRLKELQNRASEIIQKNKVSGKLCLSVHPLDYLSLSENTYNWRSCHSLDGDYRSGNLSYMMDASTVICYLKGENEDSVLPNFPSEVQWNSKKWRMLLFFSNDDNMMFFSRQYPFSSDEALNIIKDEVLPKAGFNEWMNLHKSKITTFVDEYSDETFSLSKLIPLDHIAIPIHDLVINKDGSKMFNDLLSSTFYDPIYCYKKGENENLFHKSTGNTTKFTRFEIGGACKCPICGKNDIDFTEIMACKSCTFKYQLELPDDIDLDTCYICGELLPTEELIYLPWSQHYICENCYHNDKRIVTCEKCGSGDFQSEYKIINNKYYYPDCYRRELSKNER